MSNLFQKLGDAISANINSAIDKNENPSVMADFYLSKAEEELDETRKQTAEVMADKKAIEREIKSTNNSIKEMDKYADAAMSQGNKDDARIFLEKKASFVEKLSRLTGCYEIAKTNEEKMISLCDKQTKDYEKLYSERSEIKANVAIANTQSKLNNYSSDSHSKNKSKFRKVQEKSVRMVDIANAESTIITNPLDEAKSRYDNGKMNIQAELDALEAKYAK